MLYLAIDQHRKQLTVNLRNEQGDGILKRQVSTEWTRVRKFLEELLWTNRERLLAGKKMGMKTKAARNWLAKLPLGAIDRLELDHPVVHAETPATLPARRQGPGAPRPWVRLHAARPKCVF